jgi:2-C-methyl-D-erythritol 4-phosphate cytidylyltransferase
MSENKNIKLSVIIVAGGSSRRYGNKNKLLEDLNGIPVFLHSVKKFLPMCMEKGLVMVVPKDEEDSFKELTNQHNINVDAITWTNGGSSRTKSVINGIAATPQDCEVIAVHDAARPLATQELLEKLVATAVSCNGGAVSVKKVVDSIKTVDEFGTVISAPNREVMRSAQTPQVFTSFALRTAYNLLGDKEYTDDVEVVRAANFKVIAVDNLQPNIKLTVPEDLLYLKFLLQSSEPHQMK